MKTFREAIQTKDFALTAQLLLDEATSRDLLSDQAKILSPAVDAIQITDNPNGSVHISPLVVAGLLLEQDIDPVLHMHCRDRNRIALRSDLLGAQALGVSSLIVHRGEKLGARYESRTAEVFDISGRQLIAASQSIADAQDSTDFYIGTIATAFNPKSDWRAKSLIAKADAGAKFLQTQICFDMDLLRRYMNRLTELKLTRRAQVIVSVAVLRSGESARWLRENLRGSVVPDSVISRLEQAADPEQEGVQLCAEILTELQNVPGVGGANLVTPGDVSTIPAAIHAAGIEN